MEDGVRGRVGAAALRPARLRCWRGLQRWHSSAAAAVEERLADHMPRTSGAVAGRRRAKPRDSKQGDYSRETLLGGGARLGVHGEQRALCVALFEHVKRKKMIFFENFTESLARFPER